MTEDEIDQRMAAVDKTFNIGPITMAMIEMMQQDNKLTFADFERSLRRLDSQTYLIAMESTDIPGIEITHPITRTPAPSWLWVELHGAVIARNRLESKDLTVSSNLSALTLTGILFTNTLHQ